PLADHLRITPVSTLIPNTTLFRSASSKEGPRGIAPPARACWARARSDPVSHRAVGQTHAGLRWPSRMPYPTHRPPAPPHRATPRSEEHTSELQSRGHLVCRLLLEK